MHNCELAYFIAQVADSAATRFGQFFSGFLGALVGAAASVGGMVYKQRHEVEALRRWLAQAHFDLFQDVADCASEYARNGNFGPFRERLSDQVQELREALRRDSSGGLKREEYRRVYRSLSSVDYLIFVHDHEFARDLMVEYTNDCLNAMRDAQKLFGSHPKLRPRAEEELLDGELIQ